MAVARIFNRLDQRHCTIRQLAHGADHFWMPGMADQNDMAAKTLMAHGLFVHFGNQGQVASR